MAKRPSTPVDEKTTINDAGTREIPLVALR